MIDIVIKAENLGKKYTIGHKAAKTQYVALRDVMMHKARSLWNKTKDLAKGNPIVLGDSVEEVWALKDVSFQIHRGEAVGIIGRNGAGKSTLLKILSRITEPSAGRVTIRGRIASLLEVGTGFHPELTGRENIYLNGTILGMTHEEIKRKFDEIVAFAEIETFLDTPVKRYSSGMYVRLAFAVAAHLEPEILVVDEVLAVGDAAFQQKCLGRMQEVTQVGQTVLFVSHNMAAVRSLCNSGLILERGGVTFTGTAEAAVAHYIGSIATDYGKVVLAESGPLDEPSSAIISVELLDIRKLARNAFYIGECLIVQFVLSFKDTVDGLRMSFVVKSPILGNVYHCVARDAGFEPRRVRGTVIVRAIFEKLALYPGKYIIDDVWIASKSGQTINCGRDLLLFEVLEGGPILSREIKSHMAIVHEIPLWEYSSLDS